MKAAGNRGSSTVLKKALGLSFFLFPLILFGQADDLLKIEGAVLPKSLSRGEEGVVMLRITVPEGLTISPHPDFTIEFKPCPELVFPKNFFTASDLEIEMLEADGGESLNLQAPIKIPFTVALEAARGSHILEGKIKYVARSKKEGWLVKTSSKFFASFYTRLTVIKKK